LKRKLPDYLIFFLKNLLHDICHVLRKVSTVLLKHQKIIRQDMSVIYLLLSLSILVALLFLVVFIYAVKKGQYDDTYTPSVRMLFDDEIIKKTKKLTKD
jgi:cbb3-type cytochrome oxidase maturation protein